MKKILLLLCLVNMVMVHAQNYKTDQVQKLLKNGDSLIKNGQNLAGERLYQQALELTLQSEQNKETATILKKVGVYHYKRKEYRLAQNQFRKGFTYDSLTLIGADNYYNLSLVKRKLNEQDSMLYYLEKSLILYEKLPKNKSTYNAFLSAGIIYKNRQFYDKALELLIIAYQGFKEPLNSEKLGRTTAVIASVHNRLRDYPKALQYYLESLDLAKGGTKADMAGVYNNLAIVYKNLDIQDSIISNYKKSLLLAMPNGKDHGVILQNLALAHSAKEDFVLAEENFMQAIALHKKARDTTSLLYSYNGIARMYLKKEDLDIAKSYLDSISATVERTEDQVIRLDHYRNKADYYAKKQLFSMAYDFERAYSDVYEKVYDAKQTAIVQTLQSRFEYEQNQNRILKLSLENQNNLLEISAKDGKIALKNKYILALCIALGVMLLGYYFFIQQQKVIKQRAKIEKLESIFHGQENIQRRIARDLHDIIASNFDGLRLKILAMQQAKNPKQILQNVIEEIQIINHQVRMVSHRLMPLDTYLRNSNFVEIITARLSEFQLYHKVFVQLENKLPEELNNLENTVKNNFYGIVLEILSNVSKHSHATELRISSHIDNRENMHFIFLDNGVGFKKNQGNGIGILSMQQRAEILDGGLEISMEDSGTKIALYFPLKQHK